MNVSRIYLFVLGAVVGSVCSGSTGKYSVTTSDPVWKEDSSVDKSSTYIKFQPTSHPSHNARTRTNNREDTTAKNEDVLEKSDDIGENAHTLKQMVIENAMTVKRHHPFQEKGKTFLTEKVKPFLVLVLLFI